MNCVNHPGAVEELGRCYFCAERFCSQCLVTLGGRFYCAHCKTEHIREMVSGLETEATSLAGLGHRVWAALLDGAFLFVPWLVAGAVVGPSTLFGSPAVVFLVFPIVFSLSWALYEAILLPLRGQTLGKIAMQIKVVDPRGEPIRTDQALTRAFVRFLFGAPLLLPLLVDLLPAATGIHRTAIHDMAAGTRVFDWS